MPYRDDKATLLDIIKAANYIIQFQEGISKTAFENDYKTLSAIIRQLEIMGEAAKRLTENFKKEHNHIPWKNIAGMRDVLIHAYDDLDIDRIWDTVKYDIPALIKQITPLT